MKWGVVFICLVLDIVIFTSNAFVHRSKPINTADAPLRNIAFIKGNAERQIHRYDLKLNLGPDVGVALYDLQLTLSNFFSPEKLSSASGETLILLYFAGLFTSFSPCTIGLLPLTLLYLGVGGSETSNGDKNEKSTKLIFYALGISVVFSCIGLSAASVGAVFGSLNSTVGDIFKILVTFVYFIMGLNLLEIVQIEFPSFDFNSFSKNSSEDEDDGGNAAIEALLFGGSSALIASPCSSPVLASLLTFIATNIANPLQGALLLFLYSLGYASPVVAAGALSSSLIDNILFKQGSPWINNIFATALLAYSSYTLVDIIVTQLS